MTPLETRSPSRCSTGRPTSSSPQSKCPSGPPAEVERATRLHASEKAATARRDTALAEQEASRTSGSIEKRGRELDAGSPRAACRARSRPFNDDRCASRQAARSSRTAELELMEVVEGSDNEISAAVNERGPLEEEASRLRSEVPTRTPRSARNWLTRRSPQGCGVDVEADDVVLYERMRDRIGGVALARLVQGRCDGCHVALSASEVDRIRREPPDARVECEHCGRLLVR